MSLRPAHRVIRPLATACCVAVLAACSSSSGSDAGRTSGHHGGGSTSAASGTGASAGGASSTPSAPSSTPGHPGTVTVAVSGDTISHPEVLASARQRAGGSGFDFDPLFARIAPVVRAADVGICQLETPLTPTDTNLSSGGVSFNGPHELASALTKAGYDGCSNANNHAFDRGLQGVRNTRAVAAKAGLKLAGPSGSAADSGHPAVYHAGGMTIAQLSYSYTLDNSANNQVRPPAGAPWMTANLYAARKPAGIVADAKAARAKGADLVLVSMHWGIEYQQQPTAEQREYAKALLDSGAVDYIIGNHPHVIQRCSMINGRMVNYSLGNSLSNQAAGIHTPNATSTIASQDGVVALVTFHRDDKGKVTTTERYQPTFVDLSDHVIRPVTQSSNPASFQRTTSTLRAGGDQCHVKAVS